MKVWIDGKLIGSPESVVVKISRYEDDKGLTNLDKRTDHDGSTTITFSGKNSKRPLWARQFKRP